MKPITYLYIFILFFSSCTSIDVEVFNAGISSNTSQDLLSRLDKDLLDKKPNYVIVMIGTNDMVNSKKMKTYIEYQSNIEKIVRRLKQKQIQVLLCSPPPIDSVYLLERHKRDNFKESPDVRLDSAVQILKRISRHENVYFVDIHQTFTEKNIPQHNLDLYIRNPKNSNSKDGVHPTSLGYELIAKTLFDFIKANNLIQSKMHIVCFGDSITFGLGADKKGTEDERTYPAFLKQFIEQLN